MTTSPCLILEQHGAIAYLTLNRPDVHNALNVELIEAIRLGVQQANQSADIRVIVLQSKSKHFCAGADLNWMRDSVLATPEKNLQDAEALAQMLSTIYLSPKPIIAQIQGAAMAGATGLVAACDIAIASKTAFFGLTEVKLGLIPATISPYVIQAIGARAARRYFLTAEKISAALALQLGLVHELVEESELTAQVQTVCTNLINNGPIALAKSKDLIRLIDESPITPALASTTAKMIADIRVSDEAQEGLRAFFDKRSPNWTIKS